MSIEKKRVTAFVPEKVGRGLKSSRLLLSASVFTLYFAGFAYAQDQAADEAAAPSSRAVDIITVTARKKQESELEVPESLTTFSRDEIERSNINGLSDIGLLVPNLFLSTRLDGFPNVTMRGLGGFGNTQGVGFYLDDVQLFSDASSRFGDLERIEVLKGPQGILYGGSNIGGAIKFVSKRPDPEAFSGRAKLRAGENNYFDGEAELNVPLSDEWAFRVFGFYVTDDSYIINPNSPRGNGLSGDNDPDVRKYDEHGVRVALGGSIGDNFSALGSFRYNKLDAPNNIWGRELDGDFEYPTFVDVSFNPRHNRETYAGTLNLSYDLPTVTLTSISSYTNTDSLRESDLDIHPEFVLDLFRPEQFEAITQELRLSSSSSSPFQWQIGGYLLDLSRDLDSVLNIRGGYCFLDPGVCAPPPGLDDADILAVVPFEVSRRKREQKAVFANVEYSFGNFEISGGLRVDNTVTERANLDTGLSGRNDDTLVLGRASLSYQTADGRSLFYGTFSQGFEPADYSLTNFTGANELFGYDREKANQYEAGYKGRLLEDTLLLTFSAFYIDYKDRQFELQTTDPSGNPIEGILNVGSSRHVGFETDITWRFADDFTFTGGVGFVDAEWKDGTISPVTTLDISGQQPPNTAKWSATAAIDYSRPISSRAEIFGRAQMRYKGESSTNSQFFDAPGDEFPAFTNPSFTVLDLSAGVRIGRVTVDLNVENVTDERYYIDVQEFPNFAGAALPGAPGQIIIGTLEQPRRVIGTVSVEF
ncbi:TonB-dependent receptor [Hyphococcus sp.]|uniref:TonB-dependent receptor n=1 Tax=Hyphococcus sp. TaxID=2038636 RepID=UPI003CCBBD62